MRNWRIFAFRAVPGRPEQPFRGKSPSGQLAKNLLVDAIFAASDQAALANAQQRLNNIGNELNGGPLG